MHFHKFSKEKKDPDPIPRLFPKVNVRMSKKHDRHDVLTGENSANMVPIKASIIWAHLPMEDLSF